MVLDRVFGAEKAMLSRTVEAHPGRDLLKDRTNSTSLWSKMVSSADMKCSRHEGRNGTSGLMPLQDVPFDCI